jgi:hypothetical protein
VDGDFRSTKLAIASRASSKRSPDSITANEGSASITAAHVPTESGPVSGHRRPETVSRLVQP